MEWSYTHFRVMYEALDSSNLPELVREVTMSGIRVPASHWPELPIGEARAALLELIQDGRVTLGNHEIGDLSFDEARGVLDQAEPWENGIAGSANYYEIGLTDKGVELWSILLSRFWPEGLNTEPLP